VLSIKNVFISRFQKACVRGDYIDPICPIGLNIKDITDTARSASYLDIHLLLEIDSEKLCHFPIVNVPFICSNTLESKQL
jgi:hypothetical protein